ncbi:hypothetical protein ACOCEA_14820 [Maribacter sp. CXY002]|uniref:hypothetical protein n=1 Tax=Maribacter luteocoastalis TaxID=3407671 RepID=UPI003B67F984
MENLIEIKSKYNTLDSLKGFLETQTEYECTIDYDIWETRTDANNQMAQCLVIKKNGMNAVKVFHVNENTLKINHIVPNKMMNAYFGKSVKTHRSILEIAADAIKQTLLKGPQQKAFEELEQLVSKAS